MRNGSAWGMAPGVRNYYSGFRVEKFEEQAPEEKPAADKPPHPAINLVEGQTSAFDRDCAGCLAQYANEEGTPRRKWEKVATKLSSIDTTKLHYVKVPENHIVIDLIFRMTRAESPLSGIWKRRASGRQPMRR